MRINLTKKDLVNVVYMQLGFSKQISENLIEDFFLTIVSNKHHLTQKGFDKILEIKGLST